MNKEEQWMEEERKRINQLDRLENKLDFLIHELSAWDNTTGRFKWLTGEEQYQQWLNQK